ncbi:hypothetical protein H6G04_22255 [Calothrix membranacea FACHB-236]|nr:hypothetical protein [Calothrix membranacea FACHB-236]
MTEQLTLFDLASITSPAPPPVYDPAWDAVPEHNPTVLEQDTAITLPIVEYLETMRGDRQPHVLERDTKNAVPEHVQWVESYSPSKRKANSYYRYCFKQCGKIHHIHISGGNTRSHLAQNRCAQVEAAISDGQSPDEIKQLIRQQRE